MKAIIVVDVPVEDSTDFGHLDIRADVMLKAYNDLNFEFKSQWVDHLEVNPMPEFYLLDNAEHQEFEKGYNSCIRDILR